MKDNCKVKVLIMAAGIGQRFGAGIPKQYITVGDEPMVLFTSRAFSSNCTVDEIYIVCAEDKIDYCENIFMTNQPSGEKVFMTNQPSGEVESDNDKGASDCGDSNCYENHSKVKGFIIGGKTRQESVLNGLEYIGAHSSDEENVNTIVLIHDAARPFVNEELIDRVIDNTIQFGSAIPGIQINDTIYYVEDISEMRVDEVVDRSKYYSVQTPQTFKLNDILDVHRKAAKDGVTATDDGSLLKNYGKDVIIVEGDAANIKVTTQSDMPTLNEPTKLNQEMMMQLGQNLRVGIGFDVHAFAENRKLILGGVDIPYSKGLLGHSDADVLTHALMDAMLGALSLGDIGTHFPDTDEKYKGISSIVLLEHVNKLIQDNGWKIVNADMTIIAEKPKMRSYISDIIKELSKVLMIPETSIGLKATTTEGLGFTGREEGIGSQAVVLLEKIID